MRVTTTLRRAGCALLLGLAVATCRDDPTGPGQRASLALAPVLPAQALNLAAFGLAIDSLRVIVVRPTSDTVVNTAVAFAVDQDSVALAVEVNLQTETETFDVTLQLRGGGFVLFSATAQVEVTAGASGTNPPVEIANFTYTGPGAGITSLAISPSDSVIRLTDSLRFRVDAFAGAIPVTQFYVTWSSSNAPLAPINAHGVLQAPNQRGTVQVIATTPNGIADTVPVTFVPVPVSIVTVAPIPVDVAPGSLIGPLRARVLASDGFGVKGIPVTFAAVSGGGSVDNALVVSDTGGYVATPATAGSGPVSVYTATVAGIATPATFNVSILTQTGTQLAFTLPPAGVVVDLPFGVLAEVRDAQGTVVPGATDAVTIALSANPGGATLGGTLTVNAVQGVAVFGDLTISQADSGYTLVVTAPGLAPDTTPPFAVIPGFTGRLWTNPAGGNWSDPANWSGGIVPAAGDSVYILLDGDYTVTLDVNASVGALILGASSGVQTLLGVGRTLQVDSMLDVLPTGVLDLASSTLLGPNGQMFNNGQLRLQSTTVEPNVFNSAGAQMTVRGFVRLSHDFLNGTDALVTLEADPNCCTSTLEVEGSSFSNAGQIVLTAVNGAGTTATLQVSNAQAFNLPGGVISMLPGSGGARVLNLDLVNSGTVQVDADALLSQTSADHDNTGLIQLTGGNLTITQAGVTPSFTSSGGIVVAAGRTLAVTGGAFHYASPAPGGLAGLGAVSFNSVTLDMDPDFVHDSLGLSLVATTVNGPGTLTNAAGRTLTVQSTAINAPFVNQGTFVVRGASDLNGTVTAASGTIRIEADPNCCVATLTVANGFTNDGLIELTAINGAGTTATLIVSTGTLVNATGGTIAALAGTGGARVIQAQLSNDGTLLVAQDLTLSKADADHLNSGSIQLTGANLSISQSGANPTFTTTGNIVVPAGRTFGVSGGAFQYSNPAPGGLTGSGTISFVNTTLGLGPALTHDTLSLELVNATVNGPGTLTTAPGSTMTIQHTAINAPFVNLGVLVTRGGSSLNGGVATSVGSTIQLQADPNCCVSTLDVPNGFTNNGLIELTAINGAGTTATLNVFSGFLVNAPGATIAARAGSGGARNLGAALNNQGTLLVETDMSLVATSADHVNSGLIHVTGGAVFLVPLGGTAPTFTTTGSIVVEAGRSFQLSDGAFNYANAAPGGLAGLGSFSFVNAVVNVTPALSNDTFNINFTNSTVNGPGVLTNAAGRFLTIQQTALNAPFVNQGVLIARGASSLGGAVTAAAGGTIRVQADPNCCVATLAVANPLTNDGLIELTAVNGAGTTATLDVAGGLTNGPGGTIAILPGTGGARAIPSAITNNGTIAVATPVTIGTTDASYVNNGTINVTAGTLAFALSGTAPSVTNQGVVNVASGATVVTTGGTFANASTGSLTGSGNVDVLGTTFTNDGTVAPGGSPGALSFNGTYTMTSNAVLSIELGGTTPGTGYDQVVVAGAGTLAGTLNVTLINGFTPSIGQVFTIVSGGGIGGLLGSLNLPSVAGGVWVPSFGAAGFQLTLLSASSLIPVQWTGGGPVDIWSDGQNWSTGVAPGTGDSAIINLPGTFTVTVDANATASFLDMGTAVGAGTKTLALASPTLTLTQGGIIGGDGIVNLSAGSLTGGGTLQVNGDLNWTGGTIAGAGIVQVGAAGTLTLSGTGTKGLNSRTIQTAGSVTWSGTGAIGSGGGAQLRVQSGGTFQISGDANWQHNLGGAQPRVIVDAGGVLTRSTGTGIVNLAVPLDNAGSVQVNTGTLELRGGVGTGAFAVAAGAQLDFPSATYNLGTGASLSGAGRARIVGATVSVDGGTPVTVNRLVLQSGTLQGGGTLEVQDSLLWSGGTMSGAGVTDVAAGADLVITGNVTLSQRTIVNGGTFTWTAGTIASGNGAAVQNGVDALLEIQADGSWFHNQGGTVPLISNAPGGVLLRSTGAGVADLRAAVNNAGTLQVATGTLKLNGGGTSGGAFAAPPGTELSFGGTHILPLTSSITGGGVVSFSSGTATVGGSYDVTGQTLVNGGTVAFDVPDTARTTNLALQTGTLGGTGIVLIRAGGGATWTGGTLAGNGVLRIPAGVTLNVSGPVSFTTRTLANAGLVVWNAGQISSGLGAVLSNENGGLFDIRGAGVAWVHNLGGVAPQVGNQAGGSVLRSTSATTASLHVPFTNDGTLDVQTGTLVLNGAATTSGTQVVAAAATLQYGTSTHSWGSGAAFAGLGRVLIPSGATVQVDAAAPDTLDARWIDLAGGTLRGLGVLRVADSVVWTGGQLLDAGVLHIPVGSRLDLRGASTKTFNAHTIANAGVMTWTGPGAIASGQDATLQIQNGALFQLESDADWFYNQGGSIPHIDNLTGGLIKRGGASSAINVGAALNNDGTLDLQTGSVTFSGGGSSKGAFLLSNPGTLVFGGGSHVLDVGSAVSGTGALLVSAGTMSVAGDYDVSGTTRINGGTAEFNGSKPAEITTLELSGGSLSGVGQANLHGLGTWTGGSMTGTGQLRVLAGAALTLDGAGAKVFTQRTILNSAVVTWKGTGAISSGGNAVLTNETGATLELQGDALWSNTQGGTSTLDNAGSLKRNTATGTVGIQTVVNNTGSVDVTTGTLSLAGGGTSSGIFGAAAGAVLDFGGGTHTLSGPASRVNGAGLVNFSAGNITLSSTAANAYDVTGVTQILSPAVVNFNTTDSVRMTTLQLRGGSMNGSAQFAIRTGGTALWTGGGMSGPLGSVLRIPDKAALSIGGSATKAFTGRRILVEGGATANWALGNVNAIGGATLDVQPSGVFNVSAVASWSGSGTPVPLMHINDRADMNVTTAGTTTLPAGMELRNQGTLSIAAGATLKVGADLNQLTGSTLQGDGVLDVAGNSKVVNQGTTAPGTAAGPGVLTIVGNWSQAAGTTLVIDIFGPSPGTADQLAVTGVLTTGGSLQLVGNGFQPRGIGLTIATYGTRTGQNFTTSLLGGLLGLLGINYSPAIMTLW